MELSRERHTTPPSGARPPGHPSSAFGAILRDSFFVAVFDAVFVDHILNYLRDPFFVDERGIFLNLLWVHFVLNLRKASSKKRNFDRIFLMKCLTSHFWSL